MAAERTARLDVSRAVHVRLHALVALAWERVVETHQLQCAEFMEMLADRLSPDEALDWYCRYVRVPDDMRPSVRTGAWRLVDVDRWAESASAPEPFDWQRFLRLDLLVRRVARGGELREEALRRIPLAAARAEEAVAATHFRNAIETQALLREETTPDRAVMYYIRTFGLTAVESQGLYQRALAHLAEEYLVDVGPDPDPVQDIRDVKARREAEAESRRNAPVRERILTWWPGLNRAG